MKRLTVFIICILLLASGCAKKEEKASLFAVDPLNGGAKTDEAALPGPKGIAGLETAPAAEPASTADPEAAPSPAVVVTGTAAYVFDGAEGPTLYGAAAYENTGNCPVIITNAALSFNVGGTAYQYSFVPIMNDKTVVLPGETCLLYTSPSPRDKRLPASIAQRPKAATLPYTQRTFSWPTTTPASPP